MVVKVPNWKSSIYIKWVRQSDIYVIGILANLKVTEGKYVKLPFVEIFCTLGVTLTWVQSGRTKLKASNNHKIASYQTCDLPSVRLV